ncbi:HlyD family type I secretion periplasmic adaptor subunit [Ruegeria sp. HKCCD6228]|uniref:HlyD family type I secretion periplasmic adaptor subunit n=1 Tax=Ruegeria sp. HKCCD6228 TaxID=2683001 RepID=UPI00149151F4|nr:HlyD family type I secretion periplasmic adaptor subunit [Ruegeria sp. HKCCD6228]NOD97696.1 HlyD family type I secretion periplasmic adaptor subunit [Ruegeria sp. HKCCD6228]
MSQHPDLATLAREMQGRSPVRSSLLLLVILLCLIAALLWAHLTELDDVTRVDGRIVPSGDIQLIEATEPGVLQSLHVREGQLVEKGSLLMELETTQIDSQLSQEQQRAFGLMARIQRLRSEIDGTQLDFDVQLINGAPTVVQSETALHQGRQAELEAEIAILERQRQQKQREFEEGLVDQVTAEETLVVLAEERAIMAPLVERQMEPATTLLALRRSEAEWRGRKVRAEAVTNRLQTGLDEIDDRIQAVRSRFRSAALTDLALATAELAALQPALPALRDRASRAQVRSPVRGIVNRIHRSTIGGLARSGEDLVEIVPLDDTLLVEAYVKPEDIAFLHAGQPVKVKITAYDFARYGALDGEIIRIGADTVTRSERNDEEVFVVEIRTKSTMLDGNGIAVEIIPGMIAEVDILSGRKTVLDYILQPVVKIKDQALRE